MATGENATTWGNVTNVNLGTAIEEAIVGSADVAFSNADVTITLTNTNATQVARNMRLNLTGAAAAGYNLIVPAIEKPYIVNNATNGTITVKNATGAGIAVPSNKTMWVYNDGTNVVDAVTNLTSLTLATALPVASGGTGSNLTTYCSLTTNVSGILPILNGGTGASTAAAARTALGATTVGGNVFTLTNPSAITFPRFNADNTVSALDAASFRTAVGAGTVTSVAALTIGTTGTDLSSTVADGTTTPVITLNVPTASAANRGALSSTDWSTFNSKAASGANTDITALDQDVTVTATGTIAANTIGYRGIPQNAQSSTYTFALSDAGKHIYSTNSGAQTITVPTNASVALPVGTAVTIVNNGTTAITFTTTSTTVYKAGTSTAWASGGTLAVRGMVTWLKVATDTWFVSGAGLS
jgi:hypothetical protein